MSRPALAIALLVLAATAGACAPQCTCPTSIPAPISGPPADATPPGAAPAAPRPAPVAGPLRIINDDEAEAQMRALYPRQLADVGVGADAIMEVTLDANGTVLTARDIRVTNDNFRGAALSVAHALQFTAPPAPETVVRVFMRWRTARTSVEIMQP
jgi:protein-disulfide isomerase